MAMYWTVTLETLSFNALIITEFIMYMYKLSSVRIIQVIYTEIGITSYEKKAIRNL